MTRAIERRSVLAGGLGAAALLVLSACGGAAPTEGDDEFTYWSMWKEGEPQQKALAQSIAEFSKETGIKVSVQWQGRDVLVKLQPTLNTTPAADLIDRNLAQVNSIMVSSGTAADMGPLLKTQIPGENATVGEVIPDNYLDLGTAENDLVVLPYSLAPFAMWYDSARLTDLKPDQVATWDEFRKVLDKSRRAGGRPLALDGDIGAYNELWYVSFLVNRLGPGALHKAAGDKTGQTWKQPGYLEAAKRVEVLAKGGYFAKGYNASKFPAMQQKWAAGESDFLLMGSWIAGETAPYAAKGFTYRSFPFPNDGAETGLAPADAYGWVMPKKAKHSEAARRFVAFMYGKKQMQRYVDQSRTICVRTDIELPEEMADAGKMLREAETVYDPSDRIAHDYADWRTKVFDPLVNKLITGAIGADKFIDSLRDQSASYWKRNP